MRKTIGLAAAALICVVPATAVAGEFSPYLPAPGSGTMDFNFVHQNGPVLLFNDTPLQPWESLELNSYLVSGTFGLTDKLAVDARIGYAESDFQGAAGGPITGQDGLSDTAIGLRYRLVDEFEGAPLTVTVGASGILQGLYTPTTIDSIGEGASGAQVGVSFGKFLTEKLAVAAEVGGRFRFNRVPEEVFFSTEISYTWNSRISTWAGVSLANSLGGLDLGDPGVTFADFQALEEDTNLWHVGGALQLGKGVALTGSFGRKFEGRNTLLGNFFRTGLSYSF